MIMQPSLPPADPAHCAGLFFFARFVFLYACEKLHEHWHLKIFVSDIFGAPFGAHWVAPCARFGDCGLCRDAICCCACGLCRAASLYHLFTDGVQVCYLRHVLALA